MTTLLCYKPLMCAKAATQSAGKSAKKSAPKSAKDAIQAINRHGCLLVFPLDNRKEYPSIWSAFYPRTPMRWEWDDDGDDRVSRLWHLRAELSTSNQVIYSKWFRGRATFFSLPVFAALLRLLGTELGLSRAARELLDTLRMDSPLSTKALKRATDLQGRLNESTYQRALKELWSRALIVAYGEVDDGAFPSLAIGATSLLFEDLCGEARELSREEALETLKSRLGDDSPGFKHYLKLAAALSVSSAAPAISLPLRPSASQAPKS